MKKQLAGCGQGRKIRLVSAVVSVMVMLTMVGINSVFASALLFDRGLPTTNLTVTLPDLAAAMLPGHLQIPAGGLVMTSISTAPGTYTIDTLRVWVVGDVVGAPNLYADTTFTLWGGALY